MWVCCFAEKLGEFRLYASFGVDRAAGRSAFANSRLQDAVTSRSIDSHRLGPCGGACRALWETVKGRAMAASDS